MARCFRGMYIRSTCIFLSFSHDFSGILWCDVNVSQLFCRFELFAECFISTQVWLCEFMGCMQFLCPSDAPRTNAITIRYSNRTTNKKFYGTVRLRTCKPTSQFLQRRTHTSIMQCMDRLSTICTSVLTRSDLRPSLRHRLLQDSLPHCKFRSSHMHFPHRGVYAVLALHALPGSRHWGTHLHLYACIQICTHRGVLV